MAHNLAIPKPSSNRTSTATTPGKVTALSGLFGLVSVPRSAREQSQLLCGAREKVLTNKGMMAEVLLAFPAVRQGTNGRFVPLSCLGGRFLAKATSREMKEPWLGMVLPQRPPARPQLLPHQIKISPNARSHHLDFWGWERSSTISLSENKPSGGGGGVTCTPMVSSAVTNVTKEHLETSGSGKIAQGKSRGARESG